MGFSRDVREWEAVIVCTHCDNANAPHVRTLHGRNDNRKIVSIPQAQCTVGVLNVDHRRCAIDDRLLILSHFVVIRLIAVMSPTRFRSWASNVEYRKMRETRADLLSRSLVSSNFWPLFSKCKKVSQKRLTISKSVEYTIVEYDHWIVIYYSYMKHNKFYSVFVKLKYFKIFRVRINV